jgi:hypothetical protein
LLQARLASAEVAEQRRVWGMAYRQHVLETFQLARHNQQQRQALYIGTLRRQALCMTVGDSGPAADPQSPRRVLSLRVPSGMRSVTPRRGSPLRIASGMPEAILAAQSAMAQDQAENPTPSELAVGVEHERRAALPSAAQQPFVSPFATARRPSRLAAATSAAEAALQPPQRTSSDLAKLASGSATLQHQPSPEALQSVRVVSGRLGELMRWDSERSRVASLPPAWAALARRSSMLSELHVG